MTPNAMMHGMGDVASRVVATRGFGTRIRRAVAQMTNYDYHETMRDAVRIAELKSRLSEHLRKVRRGRTLVVLDRETPIARIVPWQERERFLEIRPPVAGAPALQQVPLPPPLAIGRDIVELLMEERQGSR